MVYEVKTIQDMSQMDQGNVAKVDIYPWGGDYRPETYGILCYVKDQGFGVRMICKESDPKAVMTEQDTYVSKDSCMEAFLDCDPTQGIGYFNFEGNAIGTMLECFGLPDKHPRMRLAANGYAHPLPKVLKGDDFWGWELLIPMDLVRTFYGDVEFKAGHKMRGDFYKCGDETGCKHYGSFTEIGWPTPNFHRPELFADMVIVD